MGIIKGIIRYSDFDILNATYKDIKENQIILLLGYKSLAINLLQIVSNFVMHLRHCNDSKMNYSRRFYLTPFRKDQ